MAYGLHPQLYPYLYAPTKNPLSHPFVDQSEASMSISRHKLSKDKDDNEDKNNHDGGSSKGDDDCAIDESENVEID